MYISYEIRTKFVWSSCEVHMNRKFLLYMYFKWSSCELHMKFICNYVWNIEVAMIFICISFEVHMTHRPELSNEISYEWYEPSIVKLPYIDGLVQEKHNSSAYAMELCFSCTNPLISLSYFLSLFQFISLSHLILSSHIIISYHIIISSHTII